ncbi:MAG: hypothetical protein OEZ59_06295, partial [Deltaproteobacteria bacterium]|nr:hypothetical protein [Deltaproteobacteria bacterium]
TKVQSQGSRLNVTVNTEIGTRCTGEFQLRIIQNGEYDIFLIFTHTKANALVYFGKWDIDNSPDCQEYLSPSTKGEHGFYLLSWSHGEVFQHDRGNYWTMSSVYCTQDQNESESCRFKYFGSFEMNNSNDL